MKSISNLKLAVLGLIVTGTAAVIGCQSTGYPTPQPASGPSNVTAKVQLVNATPNASSLNFLVENGVASKGLAPGQSSGYIAVPAGSAAAASADLAINNAGGTLGANNVVTKPLLSTSLAYTIFATDTINRPQVVSATGAITDVGGVRGLQVTDTLTAPAAGTARVRFFNFSPDVTGSASSTVAQPVSARLINSAGTSAGTFTNRAYRTASGTALRYTSVPAGAYVTQVYSGTTVPSSLSATPIASSTVTLGDGKIYTLYSRGLVRDKSITVGTVQHN